jgi:RNA polymerase sigma-70 factor (ECF subfamily)
MNETELVARAVASHDAAAFAALVRLHQGKLRAFLLRLVRGDHALADDLAQETFLEAFRKIAQYRGDGKFACWLFAIAYSRLLMEARKRKLEPSEDAPEQTFAPSPDIKLDLERAMSSLPLVERAALTTCFAYGYSHTEAARILNLPLGTLKSHVKRGRERLEAMLRLPEERKIA